MSMDIFILFLGLVFLGIVAIGLFFILRDSKAEKKEKSQQALASSQLQEEINTYREKSKALENELEGLRQQEESWGAKEKELQQLRLEAQKNLEAVVNLSEEKDALKEQIAIAQSETERQFALQKEYQAQAKQLREELEAIKGDFAEAQEKDKTTIIELTKKLEDTEKTLGTEQKAAKGLSEKIQQEAEVQLQEAREDLVKERKFNQELKERQTNLEGVFAAQKNTEVNLKRLSEEALSYKKQLEEAKEKQKAILDELTTKLKDAQGQESELKDELGQILAEKKELEEELIDLRLEKNEIEEESKEMSSTKEKIESELKVLKQNLSQEQQQAKKIKRKESEVEKELALQKEADQAQLKHLQAELEVFKSGVLKAQEKESKEKGASASPGEIERVDKNLNEQLKHLEAMMNKQEELFKKNKHRKLLVESDGITTEKWMRRFLSGRDDQRIWISKEELGVLMAEMEEKNDLIKKLLSEKEDKNGI